MSVNIFYLFNQEASGDTVSILPGQIVTTLSHIKHLLQ